MCREGNWKDMTELPDITWAAIASTVNIPLLATVLYSTPFIRSIPPYDAKGRDERKKKKKELNPGNSWECIEFKTEIGSLVRYQCNHG